MAPNPRVTKAFNAMQAIGISKDKVKPVLKKLLKLYEKNWELIEEENYRVLADAIFDDEDSKVSEDKEIANDEHCDNEGQFHNEPERPLKRLRSKSQEEQALPSHNNCDPRLGATLLRKPKVEEEDLHTSFLQQSPDMRKSQSMPISPQSHLRNMEKQPVSPIPSTVQRTLPSESLSPEMRRAFKGKEPIVHQAMPKEKRPVLDRPSQALKFKDHNVDPVNAPLSKQIVPDSFALIKPKDEPFTDDMSLCEVPQYEVPIAMIRPGDKGDNVTDMTSEAMTNCELASSLEESPADLEIATSSLGEVKISLSCNSMLGRPDFHMPSQEELLKSMQEKCLRQYKFLDCNFSVVQMMKDMCDCFLELGTNSSHKSQERLLDAASTLDLPKKSAAVGDTEADNCVHTLNGSEVGVPQVASVQKPLNDQNGMQSEEVHVNGGVGSDNGKRLGDLELSSLVAVSQCQLADITKGEELVEIPCSNEINNEHLPAFNYIPQNLIFQNACVNFALSKITSANCCASCIGDCLSSSTPCICADVIEEGFIYTSEGVVKADFLEDCISMTRDPQRQCLSYCTDCPVERAKNDEMLEPCKGHLKRKYIKECWSKCGCHKQCGNRVVQRGINCKLQVFFTPEGKGWGLRTLEKLPKGAFVCEYAAEILTVKELYERNMQRTRNSERPTFPVLLDAYWCLEGAVNDDDALCLDATFHGNVARFINHRCLDSNLIEIPVKIETPDHHYYRLAYFTTREVNAMEELTWDYGVDFDENDHLVGAFRCQCGSKFCRNMKRPNRSKSAAR